MVAISPVETFTHLRFRLIIRNLIFLIYVGKSITIKKTCLANLWKRKVKTDTKLLHKVPSPAK